MYKKFLFLFLLIFVPTVLAQEENFTVNETEESDKITGFVTYSILYTYFAIVVGIVALIVLYLLFVRR